MTTNRKTLVAVIAATAAMALTVAGTAGAAEVTYPAGTRALLGQELELTGNNFVFTSSWIGPITCETLNLKAIIEKNNGTEVQASGDNSYPTQSGCYNGTQSRPARVTKVNITKLIFNQANGPSGATKSGSISFTWTTDLPAGVVCNFTGTNVPVTYVSTASPSAITTNKGGGVTSTGGCGSATLDGSFSLHGPGVATPVVLH